MYYLKPAVTHLKYKDSMSFHLKFCKFSKLLMSGVQT